MKTEEKTRNRETELEKLCPYTESCSDSNYGDREICSRDYKTCGNYFLFDKGNIIIEKVPPKTSDGAFETYD